MDQSMGLPPCLTAANTVFPRTFRFLFIPKQNPHIQYFVKKVEINYFQHKIVASVMEVCTPNVDGETIQTQDWIEQLANKDFCDDLMLVALDGCGKKLYTLEFLRSKAYDHQVTYCTDSSDTVNHTVYLEYSKMVRCNKPDSLD
jgi:hypothetical protein